MIIQLLAGFLLLLVLFSVFRFAMGLRFSKVARDEARRAEESRGRRVVAEVPLLTGDLLYFVEDDERFYWSEDAVRKSAIRGARLLLNGGVIAAFTTGEPLPEPAAAEAYEGRERWDVVLYLQDGGTLSVPCGVVREGVSREIAGKVFAAVRMAAMTPGR